ncbi:MarR family transcriptional regulator [Jiangella rhizosphaerae]|uniref:MarR family transcriptional regulator n=2 Tax=Jiangella rhizosphaerae TaxID=2293569 RepID=A0A418KHG6_9ACTN|nr:MarR family transcriptional regulator [Jiangella rhizosphaerae]
MLLLQRGRWLDRVMTARLHARGWPKLTSAQSLVFASLHPESTPLAVLTERLGTTRQSTHELVTGLVKLGLISLVPDQDDPRRRSIELTPNGRRLARQAATIFAELERHLADQLGSDRLELLRDTLTAEWEPPQNTAP